MFCKSGNVGRPLSTTVPRVFYKYLSFEDSMTEGFHDQIHLGDSAHYIFQQIKIIY